MNTRNTNVEQIKEILSTIDPQQLMTAMSQMNDVYTPQCYFNEHAIDRGFKSVSHMREVGRACDIYAQVDELMDYVAGEIEEYDNNNN
tara:strand:- start:424 stop:687 length:264 start_codon:yes stop_codon:yes gene_type:complete